MNRDKLIQEWLMEHHGADKIVVDAKTGDPVKAIYRTLNGMPRIHFAEYYFEECAC